MNRRFGILLILSVMAALALSSCTKRKPEEPDYAPDSPFNPYPPDSATNVDHTTLDVTLRWAATDPEGNPMTCDIYLDTLDPPDTLIASGLSSLSYFLTGLSYNTTYYWKLYLTDDKGVTTSGPVWRFTTLPHANTAPSVPVYLYPVDNAPWQYPTIGFGVNCTDPEGMTDTLYYDLYLGATPQPPLSLYRNDPACFWELTGLNYTSTYYWKVVARDNHYAYTSGPVYSFITRDCPWFHKRELPSPRYGFGTAVVNNKIYVMGGTNGGSYLSEVLEYDPSLDTWTRKADMPTARYNLALAVWNNNIYALGGRVGDSLFKNNEMYDPLFNDWSNLSQAPGALDWVTAHAIDGNIYLLGSKTTDFGISTVLYKYSIDTDSWQTISELPNGNFGHCSAVHNDLIYVMGGTNGDVLTLPFVDVYHPGTNTWSAASDMIGPGNCAAATAANGFIYVMGGYDGSYSKRVRKYDPLSDAWFIRSDLQVGRSYLGAAFAGGYIYAIGGIDPFILSTMEEYRLDQDPKH